MSSEIPDYYSILGVAKDADAAVIKKKFRQLARECHPDVAGDNPRAAARFTQLREAYETLVDPIRRDRYDNPPQRRTFYRQSWRPPGGNKFGGMGDGASAGRRSAKQRWRDPANQMDLEDIFGDQMGKPPPRRGRPAPSGQFMGGNVKMGGVGGADDHSSPGEDIPLAVDVSERIARLGGTITLNYARHKLGERGSNLFRYNEIYDLRIIPNTSGGEEIRIPRMGHAGAGGGGYGDLVCTVRIITAPGGGDEGLKKRQTARSEADLDVPISVVEALLGGRVEVALPGGRVRLTVPPCTSSGTRLRLRGRGAGGGDLYVRLRVVVPDSLDTESRKLIEQFALLNPDSPRD